MKRHLIACMALLSMMLLFAVCASAEVRGGHMSDIVLTQEDLMTPRGGNGITVNGAKSASTGVETTFTAAGSDDIRMAVLGVGSTDPLTVYYEYISYGASLTMTFYEPGTYYVYAWDVSDRSVNSGWSFRVSVSGTSILSQTVQSVVSQCNAAASTAYEKALWIHDYLIYNAGYDPNMNQYGAAGVLIEGRGVCDSYSRAYEILMNAMGIDCLRQSGGNHSWNAVKMDDGCWYWVDCTWDDPFQSSGAAGNVSGNETHRNFGLSDALLTYMGHTWSDAVTTCSHLEYNYYVMSGQTDPWHLAVTEAVQEHIGAGETAFTLTLNGRYELETGYYNMEKLGWSKFYYTISAYLLDGLQMEVNGTNCTLRAVYDPADSLSMSFSLEVPAQVTASYAFGRLIYTVKGVNAPCSLVLDGVFDLGVTVNADGTYKKALDLQEGEHTLTLYSESYHINTTASFTAGEGLKNVLNIPVNTKAIEAEAFRGSAAEMVVITSNCTSIGSRAFADCPNLLIVRVSENCSIASDAFEGCPADMEIIYWED